MKLLKKLVSIISSVAIVASVVSSITASAFDPTDIAIMTPRIEPSTTTSGTYDLFLNFDLTKCSKGSSLGLAEIHFVLDSKVFDTTNLMEKDADGYYVNIECYEYGSGRDYVSLYDADFAYNTNPAKPDDFVILYDPSKYLPMSEPTDGVIIRNLPLQSGKTLDDVKINFTAFASIGTDVKNRIDYDSVDFKEDGTGAYAQFKVTNIGNTVKPVVPETVAATPVGDGVFEGFNGVDTDRSVAAIVDTTITKATNKVTWKINVTPQAGKTYTGPTEKEVTFPNIDAGANMKVGLIVSYADADIANVEITGIEY